MILLSKKHYAKYKLKSLSGLRPPLYVKEMKQDTTSLAA